MNKEDDRRAILSEYRSEFGDEKISGEAAMIHFSKLQRDQPHLFSFKYPGDQWQQVHSWLSRAGMMK